MVIAGRTGVVLSIGTAVPDGEAEAAAANNPFWSGATEAVASHQAHLIVSVADEWGAGESEAVAPPADATSGAHGIRPRMPRSRASSRPCSSTMQP